MDMKAKIGALKQACSIGLEKARAEIKASKKKCQVKECVEALTKKPWNEIVNTYPKLEDAITQFRCKYY
jgi:hypothetical protein